MDPLENGSGIWGRVRSVLLCTRNTVSGGVCTKVGMQGIAMIGTGVSVVY